MSNYLEARGSRRTLSTMLTCVDPPDFEEIVLQQRRCEKNACIPFVDFPSDDVTVDIQKREMRTATPIVPCHSGEADQRVTECIDRYNSDYKVYRRRYLNYSSSQNSKLKASEVHTNQRELKKHNYEIDVIEEIAPLHRSENKRSSIRLNDTNRNSWASNMLDLKNSQPDALLDNLLDNINPADADNINTEKRANGRHKQLFNVFQMQDENEIIEKRDIPVPPTEHFGNRLLVQCLQLNMEVECEPIFAVIALYDSKERKKISENFYFDMTSEHTKNLLSNHIPYKDISTLSRSCILSLTHFGDDTFLVIRLEKVLQPGDVTEQYLKDPEKPQNKEKLSNLASQYCVKLGAYRQPFAMTAIHLMTVINGANSLDSAKDSTLGSDSGSTGSTSSLDRRLSMAETFTSKRKEDSLTRSVSGVSMDNRASLKSNSSLGSDNKRSSFYDATADNTVLPNLVTFRPVTVRVSSFFKQETEKLNDDDFYKLLLEVKKSSSNLKKLKSVPCTLKLDIGPCPDEHKYCLSPELQRLQPYPDEKGRPTKEVLEFPLRPLYVPYTTYRNLLYIYPKSVNFTSKLGSARNIAVKCQLMKGENDHRPLPVIFGKSSCPEFTDTSYTSVSYHNKSPGFYDEIKIKIPAKISQAHYILFTFYHISCQLQKKESSQQTETLLGYCWIPLLYNDSLNLGEFNLPISLEKPQPCVLLFIPKLETPGLKWLDNKPLFSVSLQAVSSVHTQDQKIDKFLRLCHTIDEKPSIGRQDDHSERNLKECLLAVPEADTEPLVQFLPLILDELIKLLVKPTTLKNSPVSLASTAFEAMAAVVKHLSMKLPQRNDMHGRNSLLTQYIHFCASIPQSGAGFHRPSSVPDFSNYHSGVSKSRTVSMKPNDSIRSFHSQSPSSSLGSPNNDSPPRKALHEELALLWNVSSVHIKEKAMEQAWFFFELMVKCMAEHISTTGLLNAPRKQRFPAVFLDDCTGLVVTITKEIAEKCEAKPSYVKQLNSSLAFFIFDILSLMDRGYVFNLIKIYCNQISEKIQTYKHDVALLINHKLDFMRIVSSHEHYLTLNLPFTSLVAPSLGSMSLSTVTTLVQQPNSMTVELSDEFRKQHYLVGIILSDLVSALRTPNQQVQRRAVGVISNLLYCHDLDPRFSNVSVRAKIAQLYLPVITITCDILANLWDPSQANTTSRKPDGNIDLSLISQSSVRNSTIEQNNKPPVNKQTLDFETTRSLLISCMWILKNMDHDSLFIIWCRVTSVRLTQLIDLFYLCLANFEYKTMSKFDSTESLDLAKWIPKVPIRESPSRGRPSRKFSFSEDISKSVILNHNDHQHSIYEKQRPSTIGHSSGAKLLRSVSFTNMAKEELSNATSTLSKKIKYVSNQTIKKSTDMKHRLEDAILGTVSARTEFLSRRKQTGNINVQINNVSNSATSSPQPEVKLRWNKNQTQWRQELKDHTAEKIKSYSEPDFKILGHLAAEVSMITLDMLEIIVKVVNANGLVLQNLLTGVTRTLLHCLAINQSSYVLQHAFASQRSLVTKYPELLFEDNMESCADLCLHLLRHCSASLPTTRSHAAASLYMLMRQSFDAGNTFARVKMQVTMSLSKLVGQNQFYNEDYLRASLKTILTYAENDHELEETTFTAQVQELVFNLHMILSDTVKMKEFSEDPEMLLDLMYRIAKGYQTSPDLRLTWLMNMAGKHIEHGNHAEAAQCYVHCAGLVVEYMNMIEERCYLPVGCVSFQEVTRNVLEESAVSDDLVSPDEEGICTGNYFTVNGLVGLMEKSVDSLNKAGMYELVNEVYKLLSPVYEERRDFNKLAMLHATLQIAFKSIILNEGKRMFGTYFRVGFYGTKFGDLNGQEFIYKEPSITKLSEIAHRLENFYGERFGKENVSIIKDSNLVETDKLMPGKAFMQLTYVEPYYDQYELEIRKTYFEKNVNIRRFMYATPFTLDGRAHGDLNEQYKRKTILTTSQAFPYIKTRIAVINKEQVILEPIQVAIEDIQKKVRELNEALKQNPLDPKILQMVLQGCIGTTVNQGPVEVASVFLRNLTEGTTPTRLQNKLRICFKDFLHRCYEAVTRNESLIGENQRDYQTELEKNYHNIQELITSMISPVRNQAQSTLVNGTTTSPNKKSRFKSKAWNENIMSKPASGYNSDRSDASLTQSEITESCPPSVTPYLSCDESCPLNDTEDTESCPTSESSPRISQSYNNLILWNNASVLYSDESFV